MSDDPIKLESGSGITFDGQTLEEYLDEKNIKRREEVSGKIFRDSIPYISPKRYDKAHVVVKYNTEPTAERIFTKRDIYLEYGGNILMVMTTAKTQLSKLVVLCLMDGKKKSARDIVVEINKANKNNDLPFQVNFGSVSAILSKISRSNLGLFVTEYWSNSRLESLEISKEAEDLDIEDAHLLYLNEMSIDEAIEKYPRLKTMPSFNLPEEPLPEEMEEELNRMAKNKKPAPKKKTPSPKDRKVPMTEAILRIMLAECGTFTHASMTEALQEAPWFKGKPKINTVSTIVKSMMQTDLGDLIRFNRDVKPYRYSFKFDVEDGMDVYTLLALYKKRGKVTIASLKKSHPSVIEKAFNPVNVVSPKQASKPKIKQKKETAPAPQISAPQVDMETLTKQVLGEVLNDTVQKMIQETIQKAVGGNAGSMEVKVSGGIDINFSFKKE